MAALQSIDALHLIGGQGEVEDVVVLGDVGGIRRAGDDDGAALQVLSLLYRQSPVWCRGITARSLPSWRTQ